MPGRALSTEERKLWARVTATVRALEGGAPTPAVILAEPAGTPPATAAVTASAAPRPARSERKHQAPPAATRDTLDGGWDRRLQRGLAAPERSIDLHGHTLAGAHAALDEALHRAVADDVRLLLVVTGRAPKEGARRGLIRAAIGDWLAASPYRDRIAAVRHAHPRHGGAGALYLVLRRRREARGG